MGNTRRQFNREFRAGAVRIVTETDKPVAHVARDLGISPYTLHNWVQADRRQTAQTGPAADRSKKAAETVANQDRVSRTALTDVDHQRRLAAGIRRRDSS